MPITFATMLMGWLAICGIPIWAGFFSKDEILWQIWSAKLLGIGMAPLPAGASTALWLAGAATALLTAIYMTRLMVMTFGGPERFREAALDHGDHEHGQESHEPRESSWLMTAPLIVLALLSTVGGLIGVPYAIGSFFSSHPTNYIEQRLEPVVNPESGKEAHSPEAHWLSPAPQPVDGAPAAGFLSGHAEALHSAEEVRSERLLALVSVLIAVSGIGVGFLFYRKRPLFAAPRLLEQKYYVDEIYDAAIIKPIEAGSRSVLWKFFDQEVIDGLLHALGRTVTDIGGAIRYLQIGFVRSYAAVILFGALALLAFFGYFARFLIRH